MPRTMEFCHPEVEWSAPEDGTTTGAATESGSGLRSGSKASTTTGEVQRIVDCGGDNVLVVGREVARVR